MEWNNTKTTTCCKGCNERRIGCHSVCERYLSQKKKLDKIKSIINKEKQTYYDYKQFIIDYKKRKRIK